MADDDWFKVLNVNLSGAFFLSQAALRHMAERGSGRIVNVSSIIGEMGNIGCGIGSCGVPRPSLADYVTGPGATKGGQPLLEGANVDYSQMVLAHLGASDRGHDAIVLIDHVHPLVSGMYHRRAVSLWSHVTREARRCRRRPADALVRRAGRRTRTGPTHGRT
jgi:hypothetical protein